MPIVTSDSEDKATSSVHSLLGGGRVADVLLWRERRIPFAILAVVTIIWYLFEVLKYNFSTFLFHIFLTTMLITFISHAAPSYLLEEGDSVSLETILVYIGWYQKLRVFAMAVLSLCLLSLIGNYIGALNLLFLGTLSLQALPFLYERYEKRSRL